MQITNGHMKMFKDREKRLKNWDWISTDQICCGVRKSTIKKKNKLIQTFLKTFLKIYQPFKISYTWFHWLFIRHNLN